MQEYRVGALAIRAELVQMPLALELLATQRFAYGSLSNRDKILTAIERTEKLWGRGTDSLSWEQRYTKQISTNATLATEAIEEITSISHEPYADVLRIEKQLQERLIGAAQESGSSRGQRTAENRIRLPFARIKSSADTVVSQVETITPIQHQMVTSNLRLVANRLKDRLKMNISDPLFAKYLNVGAQGLIAAIQRFNPDKKRPEMRPLSECPKRCGRCYGAHERLENNSNRSVALPLTLKRCKRGSTSKGLKQKNSKSCKPSNGSALALAQHHHGRRWSILPALLSVQGPQKLN
jgi:hypothetical protein